MPQSLPALATLAIVLWYMVTVFQVGRARTKYKVYAPATTGDPAFERYFRVQMNELENIVVFLPSMWIYAVMGNPRIAAILGACISPDASCTRSATGPKRGAVRSATTSRRPRWRSRG